MNVALLTIVTVIYLCVAVGYWRDSRAGMAVAFFAYALANLGFIIDAVRK